MSKQRFLIRKLHAYNGNVRDMLEVAKCYQNGCCGVTKSLFLAANFYEMAADEGNAYAQYELAVMYEKGLGGKSSSISTAAWLYELSAKGGDHAAKAAIERPHIKAVLEFKAFLTQKAEERRKDFQDHLGKATAGSLNSMLEVAIRMQNGSEGAPHRPRRALTWYEQAAKRGSPYAQYELGLAYEKGILGKPQDIFQAAILYKKSSDGGNSAAQKAIRRTEICNAFNKIVETATEQLFDIVTRAERTLLSNSLLNAYHDRMVNKSISQLTGNSSLKLVKIREYLALLVSKPIKEFTYPFANHNIPECYGWSRSYYDLLEKCEKNLADYASFERDNVHAVELAAQRNHTELFYYLLNKAWGKDTGISAGAINVRSRNLSSKWKQLLSNCLLWGVQHGNPVITDIALHYGADPFAASSFYGVKPFELAVHYEVDEVLAIMAERVPSARVKSPHLPTIDCFYQKKAIYVAENISKQRAVVFESLFKRLKKNRFISSALKEKILKATGDSTLADQKNENFLTEKKHNLQTGFVHAVWNNSGAIEIILEDQLEKASELTSEELNLLFQEILIGALLGQSCGVNLPVESSSHYIPVRLPGAFRDTLAGQIAMDADYFMKAMAHLPGTYFPVDQQVGALERLKMLGLFSTTTLVSENTELALTLYRKAGAKILVDEKEFEDISYEIESRQSEEEKTIEANIAPSWSQKSDNFRLMFDGENGKLIYDPVNKALSANIHSTARSYIDYVDKEGTLHPRTVKPVSASRMAKFNQMLPQYPYSAVKIARLDLLYQLTAIVLAFVETGRVPLFGNRKSLRSDVYQTPFQLPPVIHKHDEQIHGNQFVHLFGGVGEIGAVKSSVKRNYNPQSTRWKDSKIASSRISSGLGSATSQAIKSELSTFGLLGSKRYQIPGVEARVYPSKTPSSKDENEQSVSSVSTKVDMEKGDKPVKKKKGVRKRKKKTVSKNTSTSSSSSTRIRERSNSEMRSFEDSEAKVADTTTRGRKKNKASGGGGSRSPSNSPSLRGTRSRSNSISVEAALREFEISKLQNTSSKSVNAKEAFDRKIEILESAKSKALRVEKLENGRTRYYRNERPSKFEGATRGSAYVVEHNSNTGQLIGFNESYDADGKVNRVNIKTVNGQDVKGPHFPPTKKELESMKK